MRGLGVLLLSMACGCVGDGGEDSLTGALTLEAAFDPDPPVVGRTTLTVWVTSGGAPIDDATLTVDPQMPAHGHGSTEDPVVEGRGDGRYDAFPVTFQMPGTWVVTVTALAAQGSGQRALEVQVE